MFALTELSLSLKICFTMGFIKMKRYFRLTSKNAHDFPDIKADCYVVPTWGEPIGDDCFYRAHKWCGEDYYELYEKRTGVFICRKKTLEELEKYVASTGFKGDMYCVRTSEFYKTILEVFAKAVEEYKERVKGGEKK